MQLKEDCSKEVEVKNKKNNTYSKYIKRLLDIIISIVFIILLSPLFIIISLLILIFDRDKIFFFQTRTGLNGKEFKIYKFRTMKDEETTRIGKFLRKTSLDETPQFFNVLFGHMSFIGPRPWIPEYYKRFDRKQKRRVEVRPGIIGLAQVNGRNQIDIFTKIKYDLEYIDNLTFIMDLKILLKSIKAILFNNDDVDNNYNIEKELNDLAQRGNNV